MANRRMISKSISVSDNVNELSDFAALLFTWMIPHTDDYGIIAGTPGKIKALIVPRRKQTEKQIEVALQELQKHRLIWRYIYKNNEYLQFCKFDEHQEGLHKRTKSKNPLFFDVFGDSENFREIPGNSPLIEPNLIEPNRKEPNRKEGDMAIADVINNFTANEDLITAITNFIEMRKKLKKPMTDHAIDLMLKKLTKLSADEVVRTEILNQSILSGWTDIYELKQQKLFGKQNGGEQTGANQQPTGKIQAENKYAAAKSNKFYS